MVIGLGRVVERVGRGPEGSRQEKGTGAYRSFVSSSAKRCTSSYSSVSRHSGHLISFQRRLLRSVRMDVATHARQVVGSWVQALVTDAVGKSDTGLVSVQMMHSRSPLRMSGSRRWFVMVTEAVAWVTWYRCPKLKRLVETCGWELGSVPEIVGGNGRGTVERCLPRRTPEKRNRHGVVFLLDGGGVWVVRSAGLCSVCAGISSGSPSLRILSPRANHFDLFSPSAKWRSLRRWWWYQRCFERRHKHRILSHDTPSIGSHPRSLARRIVVKVREQSGIERKVPERRPDPLRIWRR